MSVFARPATFSSDDTVVNELVGSVSQINRLIKRIAELDTQIREMKGEIPAGYLAHSSGLPILSEAELNRWSTLIRRYRPPVASRIGQDGETQLGPQLLLFDFLFAPELLWLFHPINKGTKAFPLFVVFRCRLLKQLTRLFKMPSGLLP